MSVKKILFINTETDPYVPSTELSKLGRLVPETIQSNGYEIRTFMPKWGNINERKGQLHEVIRLSGMNIIIDGTDHPLIIKVASIPISRVQVYFIDNDDYFTHRGMERNADGVLFEDNVERAVFYARGVLETVKKLRWVPDVIQCQGWMSSIIPLYIKKAYHEEPCFRDVKVVTSLSKTDLDGVMGNNAKACIAFRDITVESLGQYKDVVGARDLEKLAIDFSDGIIELTEGLSEEIKQYAANAGKNYLSYQGIPFVDAYKAFYDSL